jgi:hypothetical protein
VRAAATLLSRVASIACAEARPDFEFDSERLLIGVGDHMTLEDAETWIPLPTRAAELDLLEIWLTRGWTDDWLTKAQLREVSERGVTPYFFGDDISVERVAADRGAWFTSLWRLSQLVAIDTPVPPRLRGDRHLPRPGGQTGAGPGRPGSTAVGPEMRRRRLAVTPVSFGTTRGTWATSARPSRILG